MKKLLVTIFQTFLLVLTLGMIGKAQPVQVTVIPENSANFTTVADLVYFTVDDALWRTDGTEQGTILLRSGFGGMSDFRNFSDKLIFRNTQAELWISNGTPGGTLLLKASAGAIAIEGIIESRLYFSASEAATGRELYLTDGTTSGTVLVTDLNPGPADGFHFAAAPVGNLLFFEGDNGVDGLQLWKTDGTSAGTVRIADINGDISQTFSHNGKYYFIASTPEYGAEPWVSDGTEQGTFLLRDIEPGPESIGYRQFMLENNDEVYFFILAKPDVEPGASIWKTSGTPASTVKVTTYFEDGFNHWFANFLVYRDKLFFVNDSNGSLGLWYTDGTHAGTGAVWGTDVGETATPLPFAQVVNNLILFYPYVQSFAYRFERTDGTREGTTTFDIFTSGAYDRGPRDVTKVGDLVFYGDHDQGTDQEVEPENYFQLTQSDGFTTQSIRSIHGGSYSGVVDITDFNGKVLFTTLNDRDAIPDSGKQLWLYDPDGSQETGAHFTLVNADTDQDMQRLADDAVIIKQEGLNINIRYNPTGDAGSVVFTLNGQAVRTENAAPFSLAGDRNGDYAPWRGAEVGNYELTATPYSEPRAQGTAGTPLTINFSIREDSTGGPCSASGSIYREYWTNVPGNNVSAIPVGTTPTGSHLLTIFEGPVNSGTNYGARISGFICPPETGDYIFWIASNDDSELWISTSADPGQKSRIAFVDGATNPRQWDKFKSQRSLPVTLTAGKTYYIEALHKQGVGTDHVAVGWQLPGGTLERPIPGTRLSPITQGSNAKPSVSIEYPQEGNDFQAPADITFEAEAFDSDGEVVKVEFFEGANKLGEDATAPYTYTWADVPEGSYEVTARATDDRGGVGTSSPVTFRVLGECNALSFIVREYWTGVQGNRVSDIPTSTPPTGTQELTILEGPTNAGTNYGARIRGFVCPPASGDYTFWIASNDHSELWLSTNDDPANKVRIAYVTGATDPRQWNKFSTQKSTPIPLQTGQQYYIEVLHKQGIGSDNVAVGWQLPDGTLERPIPGSRLSPFENDASQAMHAASMTSHSQYAMIAVYPNPVQATETELTIAGYDGIGETVQTDVEIINLTGDVVHRERINCGGDCASYPMKLDQQLVPGIYLINLTANGTRFSKRLQVK